MAPTCIHAHEEQKRGEREEKAKEMKEGIERNVKRRESKAKHFGKNNSSRTMEQEWSSRF
jgi:hypothetical protein